MGRLIDDATPRKLIDRDSRNRLSQELARLVDGESTNDEFEAHVGPLGRSPDPAIAAVIRQAWFLYSDQREHQLTGAHALTPDVLQHVARWRRFLESEIPYGWPHESAMSNALRTLASLLTFGWAMRRYEAKLRQFGDMDQWPFLKSADDAR
jgi:hypothetical protein